MEKQELTNWLNSLIGSEMIAFLQYEIASHIVVGTDYDSCSAEFKQHADEERDHMNDLLDCAIERNIDIQYDLPSLISNANPVYEIMNRVDSNGLIEFHYDSEESAIQTYKEFYNLIKDDDVTLADTIKHILSDEIEHRKDLGKIHSSINDSTSIQSKINIEMDFGELTNKLREIQ